MRSCSWSLVPLLLFVFSSLVLSACNKPEIEDCRLACWNGMKITFWDKVEQDVKGLSPEQAATLRAEREAIFQTIQERAEDPGLLNCITNCQNDSNKTEVECMAKATTAAQLKNCKQ